MNLVEVCSGTALALRESTKVSGLFIHALAIRTIISAILESILLC
jgi:CHASE2 domain-containing sensor protein